jgi:hypothetical protein
MRKGSRSLFTILAVGAALTTVAVLYANRAAQRDDTKNYRVGYQVELPWKEVPHGPQTLFLYRHPDSNLLLRGAVNQVVSDINPTPELGTNGLADLYIDLTKQNQKDWSAEKLDRIEAQGVDFQLIRRERKGKVVITAFGVRGNTTLVVSLSGNEKETRHIDGQLPGFREFLSSVSFTETNLNRRFE